MEVETRHMCVYEEDIQACDWIYWMLVNDGAKSARMCVIRLVKDMDRRHVGNSVYWRLEVDAC